METVLVKQFKISDKNKNEKTQEFGEDLCVCVMRLFPAASTLSSLVAISLVKVTILLSLVTISIVMCLVCDVISQDHVIKWSRDLMGESLSWHATILPSLLVMCIVVVEI